MGIFQSVGGASTSGAGISSQQFANAIRAAARRKADGASTTQQTRLAKLNSSSFKEEDVFYLEGDVPVPQPVTAPSPGTMKVTNYTPRVFGKLRALEGVSEEHFCQEWQLPDTTEARLGEGRSMAMFLKSINSDYIAKTISVAEVEVLLCILEKLLDHIVQYQDSLLCRYLMLLRLDVSGTTGYLLVFADVFSTCPLLHERWDLKGRIPKPGKFLHFPAPEAVVAADLKANEAGEARRRQAMLTLNSSLSRSHAMSALQADSDPEPVSPSSHSIPTRRDKDLTRLFWLNPEVREILHAQLTADFAFLSAMGLMDYSVLIGVRYKEKSMFQPMRKDQHCRTTLDPFAKRKVASESRNALGQGVGRGSEAQHVSRARYHNGVPSILGEETYYLGIIDMLTTYSWKKKTANFCKGVLWETNTLSTIPPAAYRERIAQFLDRVLVAVNGLPVAAAARGALQAKPTSTDVSDGTASREPAT